jgi:septum formation protein
VALDDVPLGKPEDEADAFRMLRALSGRTHHVYTGVCCVAADGSLHSGLDASLVTFGEMTDADIRAYIATGEPMDKAGAYALQGGAALWIEEVRGTPSGVIGRPLPLTRRLLNECAACGPGRDERPDPNLSI